MIWNILFWISCICTIIFTLYLLWHLIFKSLYLIGFNFYDFEDEYPSLLPLIIIELSGIILNVILYSVKT